MVSNAMKATIDMLWQMKPQMRGVTIPAEMIPALRDNADQMLSNFPIPEDVTFEDRTIGGIGGEYYTFDNNDPEKLTDKFLIYIHGGGFESGTVKSRRYIAAYLSHYTKIDCFSIDYSQWPEAMHPTALNECLQVYRALAAEYKAENIYLAGESGGAVLSLTSTLYLRDHGETLPAKVVAIGPVIDFYDNPPSRLANDAKDPMLASTLNQEIRYFTDEQRKSPYVSVRYADFTGFPETLITVGTEEILYDDAIILHEMMDKVGVKNELIIYDEMFHCFQLMPAPESEASIKTMSAFLRK